jgi:DNA-binding MarR family transcriptional regulator
MDSEQPQMTSTPLPLERRFGYRFHRISRALGQHMLIHAGREYGLNLAEYRVMTVLANRKSPSIKDIAVHTDLDKAHITRALANLVKRGLADQKVDASDRRLRDVRLTAQGLAKIRILDRFVVARQRRLEQRLTKSEIACFWKAMSVLSDEADKMLSEALSGVAGPKATRRNS